MFKPINGFTKATIIEAIQTRMLDHRSKGEFGCMYRAKDDNRCAVGVFIPLDHEAERFEGNAFNLLETYPELRNKMPLDEKGMHSMQMVHDGIYDDGCDWVDPRPALIDWINRNVE